MNSEQKNRIEKLRGEGLGYSSIAALLGLSKNTVKSHCQRNHLSGGTAEDVPRDIKSFCKQCGKPIRQVPGKKTMKFCSDACRTVWWNSPPEAVGRKAVYAFTCPSCHKEFTAYGNANRKYCSHECYIADRFGGRADG